MLFQPMFKAVGRFEDLGSIKGPIGDLRVLGKGADVDLDWLSIDKTIVGSDQGVVVGDPFFILSNEEVDERGDRLLGLVDITRFNVGQQGRIDHASPLLDDEAMFVGIDRMADVEGIDDRQLSGKVGGAVEVAKDQGCFAVHFLFCNLIAGKGP